MISATVVAEPADEDVPTEGKDHPLVGQIIGDRYRIDALLGEGGMGAVFRATHLGLGRPVAVKVLHPRLSDDEHIAKRFDREALAVSKLDHPNCVQVIDFGTTRKGMKYLVMQFLEGKELREITGVALPVEQAVYFGMQVLRALEHAHKRGLVHRDLKPENIFLVQDDDGNQVIKLVDFGIVKLLEDAPTEKLTRIGMAFGTPTYMSPEQAAGGKIDARTDLYAVGVVLYELLTGVPPFTADEPGILMRMQILADPPPLPDTVPRALATVVEKLLAKEPHDRYADAREARRALTAAYTLPSKITGVVGLAAVALDEPTDPSLVLPVAGLMAAQARVPTGVEMRDELAPASDASDLFARSGGTVLAPPLGQGNAPTPIPGAAASTSQGVMLLPMTSATSSMSHGAMAGPGPMTSAAASLSHGSVPIVPPSSSTPHFDPLAVSSPGLPAMGPGLYSSGAHPRSGSYGAIPTRRAAGRSTGTIIVVFVLVTWVAIGALWWWSRDDARTEPEEGAAPGATPAKGPAADGLYRFADDAAPAGASDPSPGGAAGPPGETKKPKKIKKPKHGEDQDD
jgi:hypothetical protein